MVSTTSYPNYEIVIVQVGERDKVHEAGADVRVLHFPDAANASAAKNYAVHRPIARGCCFWTTGVEPIEADWLTIMAEHVQRPEVGAVGARLINPIGTIEHAGLVLGVNGVAQSAFHGFPAEHPGVNRQLRMVRNYSAVSGACMLTRREFFNRSADSTRHSLDEFAEIDLCLKMRRSGYLIVYAPFAKLYWKALAREKPDFSAKRLCANGGLTF